MIRLTPMTSQELEKFLEWSIPMYAQAHVKGGRWKAEDAVERSRAEHQQLLPKGVETPDQYLRTVHDASTGTRVGELWYALQRQEGVSQLFVYWIGIEPQHRRRGYASDVFRALDAEARRLGAGRVALHVFGDNAGARALYEKLGYAATNIIMTKDVAP